MNADRPEKLGQHGPNADFRFLAILARVVKELQRLRPELLQRTFGPSIAFFGNRRTRLLQHADVLGGGAVQRSVQNFHGFLVDLELFDQPPTVERHDDVLFSIFVHRVEKIVEPGQAEVGEVECFVVVVTFLPIGYVDELSSFLLKMLAGEQE